MKKVNAVAFTSGQDTYFRSGQFKPDTASGLELLAHEVTRVTQQAQGQMGGRVDPDAGLESEAHRMGARLATQAPVPEALPNGFDVTIQGRTVHVLPLPRKAGK